MNGIIFDFNGTMFFDEKFQEQSWEIFFGKKLKRSVTDSEFQEYVHGRNMQDTLNYFLEIVSSILQN